jgi:hypothetical protein
MAWPVRPDSFLCINGKIWSMFLKAKMDLILMLSKLSGQIGRKPKLFCVPFNSLTVLTGLAVLMESALGERPADKLDFA